MRSSAVRPVHCDCEVLPSPALVQEVVPVIAVVLGERTGYRDGTLTVAGDIADDVAVPMVVSLASEECAYSGSIFSAGGGRYARIMAASAPGWTTGDDPASAEAVRDHLDEITDLQRPLYFDTGADEMRLILRGE